MVKFCCGRWSIALQVLGMKEDPLTLVAEGALPHGPGAVLVRVAVTLEGVRAAPVLAPGQRHAVVAQVTLPEISHSLLKLK